MSKGKTRAPSHIHSSLNGAIQRLLALYQRSDFTALEEGARQFIQRFPNHVFGHKALIAALLQLDKADQALVVANAAVERLPGDAELHVNRAAACIRCGQAELALAAADEAIRLSPGNAGAHANKGLALKQLGAWNPALEAYRRAIELNPSDHDSLTNAGIALLELEMPQQALACFQAGIALQPGHPEARNGLALAQEALKFLESARSELESLLAQKPDDAEARSRLVQILRQDCHFADAERETQRFLTGLRAGTLQGKPLPFNVLSMEGGTLADQCQAGLRYTEAQMGPLLAQAPLVQLQDAAGDGKRPLRIGYLSADFFTHATVMLMIGVLEHHDRGRFQIFAYSHSHDDGSALRRRVEAACHTFRNIKPLSYLEAARQIAADGIDILVDLKGYTKNHRLEICALRPAPVIVSWLGYPGSLGHPRLADYVIGDPVVTPPEHAAGYSEILALMPHCYQPNDADRELGPKPERSALGLPEDALVFCSFNQTYKITRPVFDEWCRLLREVPDSVLWLMAERDVARETLIKEAVERGISASRLVFASGMPIREHLGRLQQADLALDAFPYGSHTTGSDALWAGVPYVAIRGETFASRVSASLLHNVGLDELITDSPAAAIDLTLDLAGDRSRIATLKNHLLATRGRVPLFDTPGFTRDLERLYQTIWQDARQGNPQRHPVTLSPVFETGRA